MMYTTYFEMHDTPFRITPDPRYLFMSERHREALAHLMYGVAEGGGFVQLTGEVGTGKTTVCRCLLEQLPANVDIALILNPPVTSFELLAAICDELRIEYSMTPPSIKAVVDVLYRYLLDAHARDRRTVVIIDEAQNLGRDVLEQIRLLTNLETESEKLLQIILIGQPELVAVLKRQDLRQLSQRITARYHLRPFSADETRAYIEHRLRVAGVNRQLFTDAAVHRVHAESGGIPRLINVICDRALLGAYAAERRNVDKNIVTRAAAEVRGRPGGGAHTSWKWLTAAAAAAVVLTSTYFVARPRFPLPVPDVGARVEQRGGTPASAQPIGAASVSTASVTTPTATLEQVLSDPSVAREGTAFASLYSAWGVRDAATGEPTCDGARSDGIRCLSRSGTWNKLRRYNVPAVLRLAVPSGGNRYVTLVGLSDERVTLDVGGRPVTLPVGDLNRFWEGEFMLLVRAPGLSTIPIVPGTRGSDVEWLRRRLAAIDGNSLSTKNPQLYDGVLKDRVIRFQRNRLLTPDGIVGDETLAQLVITSPEPGVPLLSARTR